MTGRVFIHITRWMAAAACRAHPGWTADTKPRLGILLQMRAICDQCPVQPECAAYALDEQTHGMWAGVWLPYQAGPQLTDAREVLHRKTHPLTKGRP